MIAPPTVGAVAMTAPTAVPVRSCSARPAPSRSPSCSPHRCCSWCPGRSGRPACRRRRRPELIPDTVSLGSYDRAIELGDLARATVNSALVAAVTTIGSVLVASLAGFALTRVQPAHRPAAAGRVGGGADGAAAALLVPRFAVFRTLGLTDTLVPLVAPALLATSPFYVLVYYVAFRRVSPTCTTRAGWSTASSLRTWWRVGMPLVRPFTVAVAALCFITSWTNLLDPLVYVYRRDLFTVPLALRSLATLDPVTTRCSWPARCWSPSRCSRVLGRPAGCSWGTRADRQGSDSTWFVR